MLNLQTYLSKPIDNINLVLFRIILGSILFFEVLGTLLTGWVRRIFVDPEFTFSFMGFGWLQPIVGDNIYFCYGLMAIFAVMIATGYRYRLACISFFLLWTSTYLLQKSYYNNHNYLYILLVGALSFMPANRAFSLDVRYGNVKESNTCPQWCLLFFIAQLWIVYTYAGIAKMYPDWLAGLPMKIWFSGGNSASLMGSLLSENWVQLLIAYGGILFDLCIIPLLLWKRTRWFAFIISLGFHLFNSYSFDIGTFPYLMIGATILFFSASQLRALPFFKQSNEIKTIGAQRVKSKSPLLIYALGLYFLIQLALPVRHRFIPGDVTWTEEGHRMSWRMMLRTKKGDIWFKIVDKETQVEEKVYPHEYLTRGQAKALARSPDIVWQFVQILSDKYAKKGQDVEIYGNSSLSLNGREPYPLIDSSVDLTTVAWDVFGGNTWVLPIGQNQNKLNKLSLQN